MENSITCILTVHNKEEMIRPVFEGILNNISSNVNQVIVVLDGCTDSSESIIDDIFNNSDFKKDFQKLYTDDVFEIKANNEGLRNTKSDYVILVQDDMIIKEKDFDQRMIKPFLNFNDVFCVTSQTAHNNTEFFNGADRRDGYPRDYFGVREIGNRGPIMYNYNDMKNLGFFDEFLCPNSYDDHDLSYKAYRDLKKVSGLYWIDYDSKPEWGTGRQKNQDIHLRAHQRNEQIIRSRYPDLIGSIKNEDRYLP